MMRNAENNRFLVYVVFVSLALLLNILFIDISYAVTTPFHKGNYYALIIGNNNYQDKRGAWKKLKNPVNDAISVADTLKQRYAFSEGNINLLIDAGRGDILNALNDLIYQVKEGDSIFVFYAGHGFLNEKTKEAFWIPVDAQGLDETNYLSHETIKNKLSIIADNASHVLLVADSCFSGTIVRGGNQKPVKVNREYYRKKARLKSIQIIAAGGNEFVDDDFRDTGHSPFTYYFVEALKNNASQYLAVSEFVTNVEKNVANNARQTPLQGRLYGAGDMNGEFIFTHLKRSRQDIDKEVAKLLQSADSFFKMKKYIDPPGNNARKRYEEVLLLDSDNSAAKQGLTQIADIYVKLAEKQIKRKEYKTAQRYLDLATEIQPDYDAIQATQQYLEKERDYVSPPVITW